MTIYKLETFGGSSSSRRPEKEGVGGGRADGTEGLSTFFLFF